MKSKKTEGLFLWLMFTTRLFLQAYTPPLLTTHFLCCFVFLLILLIIFLALLSSATLPLGS